MLRASRILSTLTAVPCLSTSVSVAQQLQNLSSGLGLVLTVTFLAHHPLLCLSFPCELSRGDARKLEGYMGHRGLASAYSGDLEKEINRMRISKLLPPVSFVPESCRSWPPS